jgi:hypothetical protein
LVSFVKDRFRDVRPHGAAYVPPPGVVSIITMSLAPVRVVGFAMVVCP